MRLSHSGGVSCCEEMQDSGRRDAAGDELASLCARMKALEASPPSDSGIGYNEAVRGLSEFTSLTRSLEICGAPPSEVVRQAQPFREVLSRSAFLRHLQVWPRGYQGDYEIVEHILDGANRTPFRTWAWFLEQAALGYAIVQQHRNKVREQADEMSRVLAQNRNAPTMLLLGCGGCRDLLRIGGQLRDFKGEIVLNDIDEDALILATSRLSLLTQRYRVVQANAIHAVRRLRNERFRFVLAGGLFDYLPDKSVSMLLRMAFHQLLEEDGTIMFTNIQADNPFRPLMEYGVNWNLVERSIEQMRDIWRAAEIPDELVDVTTDETKLAMIVRIAKK